MRVELPLLEQAGHHAFTILVRDSRALVPARQPEPGEQYRFHFDMGKCIGCKCCVVACNEQNGNPAELNWRRVGEIEGGVYPAAQRWHLSMGCNHCLEPSCLIGCPVEAYTKDSFTGIVDHNPDQCIGCQYCTWNCSYGVPQYNPERGVVGKCDMCHNRLSGGDAPACVHACPEGAIAIEIVEQAAWRANHGEANAPGMPSAEDSFSTTRITIPETLKALNVRRVDGGRVEAGEPHWSLVGFLVATQFAVGGFLALWLLELAGAQLPAWAAIVPLSVAQLALAAAPLHLGRPAFAWRAVKNWRSSWVSREVLAMTGFAGAASAYAAALYFDLPHRGWLGASAVAVGFAGIAASARIYMVPARPSWNRANTMVAFLLTALVAGVRLAPAAGLGGELWLGALAAAASVAQLLNFWIGQRAMAASGVDELRASARLTDTVMKPVRQLSMALSIGALILIPLSPVASLLCAIASEGAGRYLFFTSAVPKTMASTFLKPGEARA